MTWLELLVQFCFWLLCCTLAAWIVVSVKYWCVARLKRRERMAKVEWPQVTYSKGYVARASGIKGKTNPCINCPLDDCPHDEVERVDNADCGICDHKDETIAEWREEEEEKNQR